MEIYDDGWYDLNERLGQSSHPKEQLEQLVEHLSNRLVSHFGVDVVDCWLGKDGTRRHAINEVAAAAIAHLLPVIDAAPPGIVATLSEEGTIGGPQPPPWDDHWRQSPRTASWRS